MGGGRQFTTVELQPRHYRLLLVAAGITVTVGLLILARGALFPFIVSSIFAYVLFPIVRTLESWIPCRKRWPNASRVAAILLIYISVLAAVAGALAIIIPPAFRETREFIDTVPELFTRARTAVEGWSEQYTGRIPEDIRTQIEDLLGSSGSILIQAAQTVIARTFSGVSNTLTIVIGLAIMPIFLFYVLKDQEAALEGFYLTIPLPLQRHVRNVLGIANRILGAYIRAQLFLALVVGTLVFLGLFLLGIRFSVLLALLAGVSELIPIIGPILGAIPGILVTLAISPGDIVWVVLLYVGVQQVENTLLVPRIQGRAVGIHPAVIMVILIVASEAAGLWGMIVAVPLAAVGRDVFKYFYREWSQETPVPQRGQETEEPARLQEAERALGDAVDSSVLR